MPNELSLLKPNSVVKSYPECSLSIPSSSIRPVFLHNRTGLSTSTHVDQFVLLCLAFISFYSLRFAQHSKTVVQS